MSFAENIEFEDNEASSRKKDHIDLALKAQVLGRDLDKRFYYEPMLSSHPTRRQDIVQFSLSGKVIKTPIWVSSMTGGTQHANTINTNLAKACKRFGMGMGLGSCRQLLHSDNHLEDFNMRKHIGDEMPLYANLGIAQVEQLIKENELALIKNLVEKLDADGLIIHVNPLQEFLQPEGDRLEVKPIDTVTIVLEQLKIPIIVKEVGQGMGPESLKALLNLPIEALEFAAAGGTNFAKLELERGDSSVKNQFGNLGMVGHTAEEMTNFINDIVDSGAKLECQKVIISGGIKSYLSGYYLTEKCKLDAIYGQASALLEYALKGETELVEFLEREIEGFQLASQYLRIR